jgi:hypothetical protein
MDNGLKGRNKKWLEGQCNISFEERSCNKIKKKGELSGSQPTNLDQIIYIGDPYDCKGVGLGLLLLLESLLLSSILLV